MTLSVCIPTIGPERIKKLAGLLPSPMEGVEYVVSWQEHEGMEIPEGLLRDDIKIIRFDIKGVSANRNNAIDASTGEIVLNADDDVRFMPHNFRYIISAFEKYGTLDVALFICERKGGPNYPDRELDIKRLPKGYWVGSPEISFKKGTELRFDENFGTGSGLYEAGEDEKLLYDARKRGLKCRFFPVVIARHDEGSMGVRKIVNPKIHRASGKIIRLEYPASWFFRVPLKAYRLKRSQRSTFRTSLSEMWKGALKS